MKSFESLMAKPGEIRESQFGPIELKTIEFSIEMFTESLYRQIRHEPMLDECYKFRGEKIIGYLVQDEATIIVWYSNYNLYQTIIVDNNYPTSKIDNIIDQEGDESFKIDYTILNQHIDDLIKLIENKELRLLYFADE